MAAAGERELHANDVCRLESLRTLEQVKLHHLAFVQRAVAVLLDSGEMDENVLSRGPLDEAVAFGSIEPFHCSFLSHETDSFRLSVKTRRREAVRGEAGDVWRAAVTFTAGSAQKQIPTRP